MKKVFLFLFIICALARPALAESPRDEFFWLGQINKATSIINTDENILTKDQGHRFAKAIDDVIRHGDMPGGRRPRLVTTFEPLLLEAAGPEITMIHAGRSSQDMLSTVEYAMVRENVLDLSDALCNMQETLLGLAEAQKDTIVPSYTNGVAAQPNRYSHYLLAYTEAFERDMDRLKEFYGRLNRSPMGATVLNGTGWPLNRDKMAALLGFDGLAYNTYSAGQIFSLEYPVEAGGVAGNIAIHIGGFIEDIMQQYAQPRPWIILKDGGENTYASSAMPQKRNPGILNSARTTASDILGQATAAMFRSHNIPPGMADARSRKPGSMVKDTAALVRQFERILKALVIDPERSLEELNLDWTCSQEIADVLMRKYKIPFRTGHHFVSEIVTFARAGNIPPSQFKYSDAREIYGKLSAEDSSLPMELPMTEEEMKAAMDPVTIVNARAVKGGPQLDEMAVMSRAAERNLKKNRQWTDAAKERLDEAEARLNREFDKLLGK
ncbi:MAG: hypothetical protein LUF25_06330 [Phascolarctobacterium sp.]|nr:hypothetical protein [Phascolarctobacterium sp.]